MTESGLWDEYENVEHVLPPELWLSTAGKVHARDCPHLDRASAVREIGAESARDHPLCRRCFGQPLKLAALRPQTPVEEIVDDGGGGDNDDDDARLGEVPDIVVTSTNSSIVHAPAAENGTKTKCRAGRGVHDTRWRRVAWRAVAPTHSLCERCFQTEHVDESAARPTATGD